MSDQYPYPRAGSPSEGRYWNSTREIKSVELDSPLPSVREVLGDELFPRRTSGPVAMLPGNELSPQLAYQPNNMFSSPMIWNNQSLDGDLREPILPIPIITASGSRHRAAWLPVQQPGMSTLQASPLNHAGHSDSTASRGVGGVSEWNVTRPTDTGMASQSSLGHQSGCYDPCSLQPAGQQIMEIGRTFSSDPIPATPVVGTRTHPRLWNKSQDEKILEMRDKHSTWPEIAAVVKATPKQVHNRHTILDRERKADAAVGALQLPGISANVPNLTVLKRAGKGQVEWTTEARNWVRNRIEALCSKDAVGNYSKSMALDIIAGELNRKYDTTLTARMLRTQLGI